MNNFLKTRTQRLSKSHGLKQNRTELSESSRSRTIRRAASNIGGYDVFISYRHTGNLLYALELERRLKAKGLLVFRDESDEDVGTSLDTFIKRACSARTFVILVTDNVYESSSVFEEFSAYLIVRLGRWNLRPFSRVIPVNVDRAIERAPEEPKIWQHLSDFVFVADTKLAVKQGIPSDLVVQKIVRSSSFLRSWLRFFAAILISGIVLAATILGTSGYLYNTLKRLSSAQNELSVTQEQTAELEQERQALTTRNAAINWLSEDPVLSYRLAEKAYKQNPNESYRKVVRQALSAIDLAYQVRLEGLVIEDVKSPLILLKESDENQNRFFIYDMRDGAITEGGFSGSQAWIIPTPDGWRTVSKNWAGDGLDAAPTFQLHNDKGQKIGNKIVSKPLSTLQFLTVSDVLVRSEDGGFIKWDLLNDTRENIEPERTKFGPGYFRSIYGALDVRSDGKSAVYESDGLALMDTTGQILDDTYTQVSFDPASFYSSALWSHDDLFLALNYFDRKRLGIWNPARKTFHWLDPNGWVVDQHAWSNRNHTLAFSGRTENNVDVTLEILDAKFPKSSRRIILSDDVPARSIAFMPDDNGILLGDRNGVMRHIDVNTGALLGKGAHPNVGQLYSSSYGVYSTSDQDFRVWDGRANPSKHWTFVSKAERTFGATGAVSANWNWIAVPFREQDKNGIEVREIINGKVIQLEAPPDSPMNIVFSPNSKWLVLQSTDNIWIYDTNLWNAHKFALIEKDRQYFNIIVSNTKVRAHVLGSNYMNNSDDEFEYVISLASEVPKFLERLSPFVEKDYENLEDSLTEKAVEGWNVGNLFRYRSAGLRRVPNAKWASYIKCRDQALGARDCDIQFIPLDIEKLIELYDDLIWKPDDETINSWIDASNSK
ncbi:toll/interleukin-1 receptor domain-containing protein [Hellea balneolensis]|uniref:toll/interleukin-1 receptor domain-containing protein n=1 Tax=Hellea balneolensis TaxID=287478 RepID=UPI0003FD710E|nr:toll/interleukin-1 receptor domain-containing protein [Hellea balneolensis]